MVSKDLRFAAWRWRSTGLVLVVLACCTAITARITSPEGSWPGLVNAAGLVSYPALLAAFLMLDIHGRVSGTDLSPWLAIGMAMVATQGLLLTLETWRAPACCPAGWPLLADAVLAVLLFAMACLASIPIRIDPGLASLTGGFGLAALHLAVGTPAFGLGDAPRWSVVVLVAASGIFVSARVITVSALPPQAARALAGAVLLLLGQRLVVDALPADGPVVSVLTVAAVVVGASLGCGVFAELLRSDVQRARRREVMIASELDALRGEVREHRERLHEVRASIASILSASDVLSEDPDGSDTGQRRLLAMLRPETARLHRLLESRAAEREPFGVDEVIEPVVLAHRATGQVVHWARSDAWVVARRDDVAQIVRILLDNAAAHAPGADVSITTASRDGWVEVVVTDEGLGVPPGLRARIFDFEVRRKDSPGSGIGLPVAQRLATASNGYLELARRGQGGASFVVGLPEIGRQRER